MFTPLTLYLTQNHFNHTFRFTDPCPVYSIMPPTQAAITPPTQSEKQVPATSLDLKEQRAWSFESSYLDIMTLEEFLDGCAGLKYRLDVRSLRTIHPLDFKCSISPV